LVQIIPQIKKITEEGSDTTVDLTLSMESLFQEYFKSKNKGQEPSEGLLNVFREVLGTEE
jgi:exonuclease SbcD